MAEKLSPYLRRDVRVSYITGFSENVRVIFERFKFGREIERMYEAYILYMVISKFCDVDLHPDNVD